jgi:hypothetical protein
VQMVQGGGANGAGAYKEQPVMEPVQQQQQRAHAREGAGETGKARASLAAAVLEACALPSDAGEAVIREACRAADVIAAHGGTVESLRRFAETRRKIPKLRYLAQDWLEWRAEHSGKRPAARASPAPAPGCPECRGGDTPGHVLAPDRSRMVRCVCNPPKPKQAEAVTA